MRWLPESVLVLIACGAAWGAAAQGEPSADRALRTGHTEVATVRMVLLSATVEDRRGRRVEDLTEDDFVLYEDRVPQRIEYFARERQEFVAIAFLLDLSGSMRIAGKLSTAKEAIRSFVESLRPLDQVGLIGFADEQVTWITSFTTDHRRFLERLSVQRGYGQTALHDAVGRAPRMVAEAGSERNVAIVLLTDGVDNRSRLSEEAALTAARRSRVPIHAVAFTRLPASVRPDAEPYDLKVIRGYAEETGGRLFLVDDASRLPAAVERIEGDLRSRYLIGYRSSRRRADGGYRAIRLETTDPRLVVRSRKGYFARSGR